MKIAVGQLASTANVVRNGEIVSRLIQEAAAKGAKAIFLPEASDYIGSSAEETVKLAAPEADSIFLRAIRSTLADLRRQSMSIYVSVGLHEPTDPPSNRVRNSLLWIDPNGKILQRYQKIHLFDVDIANGPIIKESNRVEPGVEILKPFQTPFGKIGAAICFDIRFPEMALKLRSLGADILLYPSAFTMKTGEAHWHTLSRARAIDNQCYVINAAQAGAHDPNCARCSYGHSLIIDPWGEILAEASGNSEELIFGFIDKQLLSRVRANMPLWSSDSNRI